MPNENIDDRQRHVYLSFIIFQVLNLKPDASQKEIEAQCRTLSRKWHPDRYRVRTNPLIIY
jgi:DnaJ-class molecular chaperone